MNKRHVFYVGLVLLAALALFGAPLAAMADHTGIDVTLKPKPGMTLATDGYSPKQTCGGCHINNCSAAAVISTNTNSWCETDAQRAAYAAANPGNAFDDYASGAVASSHAEGTITPTGITFSSATITSPVHGVSAGKHSQMGRNEEFTAAQRSIWGVPATSSSPGMWGRYCPPSNRILSNSQASNASNIDLDTQYWARNCGGCHVGGGFMEYDRAMNNFGAGSIAGDRWTFVPSKPGTPWYIADIAATPALQATAVWGDNNVEVDCLMCHMKTIKPGVAWYKSAGCGLGGVSGPSFAGGMMGMINPAFAEFGAHDPNCVGNAMYGFNFVGNATAPSGITAPVPGTFYDMFNRGMAIYNGWFGKAAMAGLGVRFNYPTGNFVAGDVPTTVLGANIEGKPSPENCAQCHARNEAGDSGIPVPGNSAVGGMKLGFGAYWRTAAAGTTFDYDKITAAGECGSGNCSNSTLWSEFGCKTGMGKRSQRVGAGSADKWSLGFCAGCNMFTNGTWSTNIATGGGSGFCQMPSVQAMCDTLAGGKLNAQIGMPIPNKLPDYDIHDIAPRDGTVVATGVTKNKGEATGIKCADCHYFVTATAADPIPAKTISANVGGTVYSYTYPANTDVKKIDHMFAQGNQILEKSLSNIDGTTTCESCHTTMTNPNLLVNGGTLKPPVPGHAGFPAVHFEKIDCRTCHIPQMYNSPGRLLSRDWTAGPYRLMDGGNGNPNHFEFSYNFASGNMNPMPLVRFWSAFTEDGSPKIVPALTSTILMWNGSAVRQSDNFVLGWAPGKQRDVGISAALASASEKAAGHLGIRINGTNDHPPFDGFQLTDPFKVNRKDMITAMAAELDQDKSTTGGTFGKHGRVRDPRLNLQPIFFDPSHGVTPKEYALGAPSQGGCVMCHSSSTPCLPGDNPMTPACDMGNDPNYSSKSVGFFDTEHEMVKNLMTQFAEFDCGEPGWNNATQPTYCAMFDSPTVTTGSIPGTCDAAEQDACKAYIVDQGMTMVTGVPTNVSQYGVRMDGLDFMGVFAVKEGGFKNGCDPRFQLFGMDVSAQCAGYTYTRQEIRDHYQIPLQQSTFTPVVAAQNWVNPITNVIEAVGANGPLNRVYGIPPFTGKNPSNSAHANKFDMGKTCWKYPTMQSMNCGDPSGCTKTCAADDYIKTAISANTLLGYTPAQLSVLQSLFSAATPSTPVARFSSSPTGLTVSFTASASTPTTGPDAITSYAWTFGDGGSDTGVTPAPHTYTVAGTYTVILNVCNPSGCNVKVQALTVTAPNTDPVAGGSAVVSGFTATVTDASTDADTTDTLAVLVNWGDGTLSNTTQGGAVSHVYSAGTYSIYLHVTDKKGGNSTILVGGAPISITGSLGSISGTVTTNAGAPIENAVVYVYSGVTGSVVEAVYTAATGSYTLSSLPTGTYTVRATKNTYFFDDVTNVSVTAPNETSGVNIAALATYSVSGTVINAPTDGLLIQLCTDSTCAVVMGQDLSYAQLGGGFNIQGIPHGTYTIKPQPKTGHTVTTDPDPVVVTITNANVVSSATITYN